MLVGMCVREGEREGERELEEKQTGKDSYQTNHTATYERPTDANWDETRKRGYDDVYM